MSPVVMREPRKHVVTSGEVTAKLATIRDAPEQKDKWLYSITGNINRAGVVVKLGIEDPNGDNHWLESKNQPTGTSAIVNWTRKVPIPLGCRIKATFVGLMVAGDIAYMSAITEEKTEIG